MADPNTPATCPNCGDDCWHVGLDYPWCRPCGEHHRPPECAINQAGEPLAPCGCTWTTLDAGWNATGYTDCPHIEERRG